MRIKSMPRFILFLSILFVLISCLTNMFINSVFSYEEPKYETITVCKGETLWSIASGLKGNVNEKVFEIKKLNNLENSNLYIGQTLVIPSNEI